MWVVIGGMKRVRSMKTLSRLKVDGGEWFSFEDRFDGGRKAGKRTSAQELQHKFRKISLISAQVINFGTRNHFTSIDP